MRTQLLTLAALTALTAMIPMQASAGDILRSTPVSNFTWRTTECQKPIQNMSSAISKQQSLQAYAKSITAYLTCIQQEAQRDFQVAQTQMQDAVEAELKAETDRMDEMIKRAYLTAR